MQRIKVSKYFHLDEFIDPHTYLNEPDNGLSKIDSKLFAIADFLRELKGAPITINNWWICYLELKDFYSTEEIIKKLEASSYSKWSGLRTSRCSIGRPKSAHKLGKAIDPKGIGKTLFKLVEDHAKEFYALGVRRLEDVKITPTWLHIDTMEKNTVPNSIRVVDLKKCTKTIKF